MHVAILSLAASLALAVGAGPDDVNPALPAQVVARIEPASCIADIRMLVGFGTRHTLSDTSSPTRGIGAARAWLAAEMNKADGGRGVLRATLEEFEVPPAQRLPAGAKMANVVGVITGTKYPERRYYVVGHYDSRASDPLDAASDAPGANDDGSGTVVTLQIARALANTPLESTVVLLCTAGEEQGLYGAKYHADQAKARGEKILGVLSNDIVGDPRGDAQQSPYPDGPRAASGDLNLTALLGDAFTGMNDETRYVRVFSESLPRALPAEKLAEMRSLSGECDTPSRQLARYVADIARREGLAVRPKLIFRPDRFLRGGDHSAFNDAGFAAVRFTVPREEYARQHQDVKSVPASDGTAKHFGDTPDYVHAGYLAGVARLNAAALVHLANAPSTPGRVRVITARLMNNTQLRWDASPEPDTVGYEVVWRETTAPDWQEAKFVGNVAETTLGLSKDDYFFGVRAVDAEGYRSPVGFAGSAAE